MDPAFWHDRWRNADIGFHQKSVNDLLVRHWAALDVPEGATVFVPLCGKSLDMVWLAEHGHPVLGVELSRIAVEAFFAERSRGPGIETVASFDVLRAGPWEIWCGDFLALPQSVTRRIGAVYDRAALVAMPRVRQKAYADKLAELTPPDVRVLLIGLDFDPSVMDGPPFPVSEDQVRALFDAAWRIRILERRDGLAASENLRRRGLTALEETAYLLERRV